MRFKAANCLLTLRLRREMLALGNPAFGECRVNIQRRSREPLTMEKTRTLITAWLTTVSLLFGGQVAHAQSPVSINSVGSMDDGSGFVLDIPQILANITTLLSGGFVAATTKSGFNVDATVDCGFVVNNKDGSHDVIVSGTAKSAEVGSLVPPGKSQLNVEFNQYYGRVNISKTGVLSRSNFPTEYEGCAFSGSPGEPIKAVLPAGFPTGSTTFCNKQNFQKFSWITCKQLQGKSTTILEKSYGLAIDRTMKAGITVFQ